jgi:predicted dithiol-disulfide oxidoreductase (DUF899 family)
MRFPNEFDEYRAARDALLEEEIDLRRRSEAVAEQRRGLPLGGEVPTDWQNPIATVFVRRNGAIHHFWSSELFFAPNDPGMHPRHVDFIWPVWNVFDCTPEGRGTDWFAQLAYR